MLTEEQHFELLRNCKIGGDGMEYQEIDIEIDSLTNCLVSKDGKEFDTEYKEFRKMAIPYMACILSAAKS